MEVAHQASHSALGEWHVEDGQRVGWSVFGLARGSDTRRKSLGEKIHTDKFQLVVSTRKAATRSVMK